jgi:transposase InsO family protein
MACKGSESPSVLDRSFAASAANRKWNADFTYMWIAAFAQPSGAGTGPGKFADHPV